MSQLGRLLFSPLLPGEYARRLRLFRIFLYLQVGVTIPLAVISVLDSGQVFVMGLCLAMILLAIAGYWLAKRKFYHLGVFFLLLTQLSFICFFTAFYGTRGPIPSFFIWPVMVATILMEPATAFLVATLAALLYGGLSFLELYQALPLPIFRADFFDYWHRPADPGTISRFITDTVDMVINYYGVAFITWIASRSLHQALDRSQGQAAELERYRAELEGKVTELHRTTAQLQASLEVVREVGSLMLPVYEGVLLAPLFGRIDDERARLLMDRVLQGTAERRVRAVILDITGVPVVDTVVVQALVRTARGVRLLGATPILVGIRSGMAQTIVDLGVDLRGIVTRASLQEGLAYALEAMGAPVGQGQA